MKLPNFPFVENINTRQLYSIFFLNYSLSHNCRDTFVSPCPLNVGAQGLVTDCDKPLWEGQEEHKNEKKTGFVQVSQLFLSETVDTVI